ncbi:MAG: DUF72 domain-containing protein [Anaerolineales bacterium]
MIRIGTSGFSYRDWLGVFYPAGLKERDWLPFYAKHFSTVELNVTFYRLPARRTLDAWIERTPAGFQFAVKAFRGLTHERTAPDYEAFAGMVAALAEAGKLACVLAQFPPSFRPVPANLEYLERLRQGLATLPLVVEFRSTGWAEPERLAWLRAAGLSIVSVDEPELPGLPPSGALVTGPLAYVRFHGRNAAHWRSAGWQRYDYLYTAAELEQWVPRLRALEAEARDVLVYFNNTPKGQAIENVRLLDELLGKTVP